MGTDLGARSSIIVLLTKALLIKTAEETSDGRWLGRSLSNVVNVEVEGDPVTRVSLVVPVRAGAGTIVGQFVNTFAPTHRRFVTRALNTWSRNPLKPLDKEEVAPSVRVRIQGLTPLVIVTIYAGGQA